MNLGLFNCRLIQAARDQLLFFATGSDWMLPPFAFFSAGLVGGPGCFKGARFWRGEASFDRVSWKAEGRPYTAAASRFIPE